MPNSHRVIVDRQHLKVTHKASGDREATNRAGWLHDADKLNALADSDELEIVVVEALMRDNRLQESDDFDRIIFVGLG